MYELNLNTLSKAFSFTQRLFLRQVFNIISVCMLWLFLAPNVYAQEEEFNPIQFDVPNNVYLNTGSFAFITQIEGVYHQFINDDDYIDLVITLNADFQSHLIILLGQEDGTFKKLAPITFSSRSTIPKVLFEDFDNDQILDIALFNKSNVEASESSIEILLGSGDGTFTRIAQKYAAQRDFTIGDFDNDRHIDLVTDLGFFTGNGNGQFELSKNFLTDVPGDIYSLSQIDADRNEQLELIIGTAGLISLYTRQSDGSFISTSSYNIEGIPTNIVVDNLNEDAQIDFALFSSSIVYTFFNQGNGEFKTPVPYRIDIPRVDAIPASISTANLNEDTHLDLVVSTPRITGKFFILRGMGQEQFFIEEYQAATEASLGFTVFDFNDDQHLDFAYPHSTSIEFAFGDGLGEFTMPRTHVSGDGAIDIVADDFDNEPGLDIVAASSRISGLSLSSGRGDGTFKQRNTNSAAKQDIITSGNFINDDSLEDLAFISENGDLLIARNQGGGSFFQEDTVNIKFSNPQELASGEFVGDTQKDLAIAHENLITILSGQGDGEFQLATQYEAETTIHTFLSQDYNQDNFLDFAVMTQNKLTVVYGSEQGPFAEEVLILENNFVGTIGQADFNGDDQQDIVTIIQDETGRNVCIHLGQADGQFINTIVFSIDSRADKLLVNDFNADQQPDIVLGNTATGEIEILQNLGNDQFKSVLNCRLARFNAFISEDLNSDDLPDLIIQHDVIFSVILNTTEVVTPSIPQLDHFLLIQAAADTTVKILNDGDIINLEEVGSLLAIVAETASSDIGSVQFNLNGEVFSPENFAPFALGRNQGANYFGINFTPGDYTLTALPYARRNLQGQVGSPLSIHFQVLEAAPEISNLSLINTDNGQVIRTLQEGAEIEINHLPSCALTIQANGNTMGSVYFKLSGAQSSQRVEQIAPFTLFGNIENAYSGQILEEGTYTIEAIPYSGKNRHGIVGKICRVNFKLKEGLSNQLEVFPNQTMDALQVRGETLYSDPASLQVYDAQGRLLWEENVEGNFQEELHLASFGKGVFHIRIVNQAGIQQRRVLVK